MDLDEIATLGEDSPTAVHGNSPAVATTWKQVVQELNGSQLIELSLTCTDLHMEARSSSSKLKLANLRLFHQDAP